MMPQRVVALGEVLVEIMRPGPDQPLDMPGSFEGPFVSGAPAIFACACARLGTPAALAGTVGDDPFGRLILRQMARDGLDASHVATDPRRPTGCAFVAYRSDGRRDFVFHVRDAAAGVVDPTWPPAGLLAAVGWLHVCGSTLALSDDWRTVALRAARLARERGARVSFDPNVRPELLGGGSVAEVCGPMLRLADTVLPSGAEATMLTGELTAEAGCLRLLEFGADLVCSSAARSAPRSTRPTPATTLRPSGLKRSTQPARAMSSLLRWRVPSCLVWRYRRRRATPVPPGPWP